MFKHDDSQAKWALASYVFILVIHGLILVLAILTLNSASEAGDWGGLFATIFGLFFLAAGGLVTGFVGLSFILFLVEMRHPHSTSFLRKLSKGFRFLIMLAIFIYAFALMIGGLRQSSGVFVVLAIPTLSSSAYLMYYTIKKHA